MKFTITRTSGSRGDSPCEGAVRKKDKDDWKPWEIEISTLEELVSFSCKHGDLVFNDDSIEIYDNYRE